jgi:hypothetical protein
MVNKDKTGDQLVATIRKSKTGAVAQKTATRSEAARTETAMPARAMKKTPAPVVKSPQDADSFSHERRVWPD